MARAAGGTFLKKGVPRAPFQRLLGETPDPVGAGRFAGDRSIRWTATATHRPSWAEPPRVRAEMRQIEVSTLRGGRVLDSENVGPPPT